MDGLLSRIDGQATVEAAFLLPTVLLTMGLLLEPACLLYTRMAMRHAAAETARLLVTAASEDDAEAFCLRRLEAVPEVGLFHTGGQGDWEIGLSSEEGMVRVTIRGHARPLPLLGLVVGGVLGRDERGVVLEVDHSARLRPEWLGGDEHVWSEIWG
ncbi:MAG: pilus assembly protein [Coriobacteriaceae bacterium]|nr:pilus assembly protein [Coriobacteriaceae bacterium]